MKIDEKVIEMLRRQQVTIDEMQFGFMAGCTITNGIFILGQLDEKYLAKKKNLHFALVDLEKLLIECLGRLYGGI